MPLPGSWETVTGFPNFLKKIQSFIQTPYFMDRPLSTIRVISGNWKGLSVKSASQCVKFSWFCHTFLSYPCPRKIMFPFVMRMIKHTYICLKYIVKEISKYTNKIASREKFLNEIGNFATKKE